MIHTYGHDGTIHDSEHVDVEVDNTGKVVAVWFRCMALPFKQSVQDDYRADMMRAHYKHNKIKLKAVQYEDGLPRATWFWQWWWAHKYMCVRFTVPRYTIALMAVLGIWLGLAICGSIWPS